MENIYGILGGDNRNIKLSRLLAKEKNIVYTYGLEKAEEIKNIKNINICTNLKEMIEKTNNIISAIPFRKMEKILICLTAKKK